MNKFTLKELKTAVINEDLIKLEEITKKEPFFSSIDEAKEFVFYIKKATELLKTKKDKLLKDMNKIKKLKNYTS